MFATEDPVARDLVRRCLSQPSEPEHRHVLADYLAERGMYHDLLCDMLRHNNGFWAGNGYKTGFAKLKWHINTADFCSRFGEQYETGNSWGMVCLGDNAEDLLVCCNKIDCTHHFFIEVRWPDELILCADCHCRSRRAYRAPYRILPAGVGHLATFPVEGNIRTGELVSIHTSSGRVVASRSDNGAVPIGICVRPPMPGGDGTATIQLSPQLAQ